jgi:hypothetical protein
MGQERAKQTLSLRYGYFQAKGSMEEPRAAGVAPLPARVYNNVDRDATYTFHKG